jgi:hypothetical protein
LSTESTARVEARLVHLPPASQTAQGQQAMRLRIEKIVPETDSAFPVEGNIAAKMETLLEGIL